MPWHLPSQDENLVYIIHTGMREEEGSSLSPSLVLALGPRGLPPEPNGLSPGGSPSPAAGEMGRVIVLDDRRKYLDRLKGPTFP